MPGSAQSEQKSKKVLNDGFSSANTGDFVAGLQTLKTFYKTDGETEDIVTIFNTSGSTGFSKLVPLSHKSLLDFFDKLKSSSKDSEQHDIYFNIAPLGWLGGTPFITMVHGNTRVLLDMCYGPPEDMAAAVWDCIGQEKCDEAFITPFITSKIMALEDREHYMMKRVFIGGQPLKTEMVQQALKLAERVVVTYGSTELGFVNRIEVTDMSQFQDLWTGKPLPNSTVKVCCPEGIELPRGTKGEIYAKTTTMTEGYFNNEEDTLASFSADGFLKTGDIGVMLEDGSLLVEGRQHDAIHRGYDIFYPAWMESRIFNTCPGLRDVLIVGVPDPAMGEEICACFVPSDPSMTEERVLSLVEEDILTKVEDPLSPRPRYYLSFQAFPRTYTDKPQRKDVRRLAVDRLNLI